jgi:AraC-like DNA-binding protein
MMRTDPREIPVYSGNGFAGIGVPGNFFVDCFEKANIWQLSPHRRSFYQVIFFREGTGKQSVDFKPFLSDGPALVLLSPNQVHQMDISTDARGHILMLPESFFSAGQWPDSSFTLKEVFDNIECFPFLEVDPPAAAILDNTIRQIQRAQAQEGSMQPMILLSYVKIFLLQVYQIREQHTRFMSCNTDPGYRSFRRFKTLIEQQYQHLHQPNEYAKQLHITPKYLNLLCRKYSGVPAGDLIRQRVLLEAKRYLHHGILPVKELAYRLGFEDPDYFNRFFKKETGFPPGAFRKKRNTLPV